MEILKLSENKKYKSFPYDYLKSHRGDQVDLDGLFQNVLSKASIPEFFLAILDDKVVGIALIDYFYYEKKNNPWLGSVYVLEEYRGKGIGAKLIKEVEKYVRVYFKDL